MAMYYQRSIRGAGTTVPLSWFYMLLIFLYNSQVAMGACGDSINPVLQACTDSSIATLSAVTSSAVFIDLASIATAASAPCACHVELLEAADDVVFVLANLESSTVTSGSSCTSYAEQDGQCGSKDFGCLSPENTWSEFLLERPIKPNTTFNFMPDTASDLCIKYTIQRASGNAKMWCISNPPDTTIASDTTTPTTTTTTTTPAPTTTTAAATTATTAATATTTSAKADVTVTTTTTTTTTTTPSTTTVKSRGKGKFSSTNLIVVLSLCAILKRVN